MSEFEILVGDCREKLAGISSSSIQTCVTSPPYFVQRDYGHDGQVGLEGSVDEYVQELVTIFREVRRVLKDDGTLWLNLGDSYAGSGRGPVGKNSIQGRNQGSLTSAIRNRLGVDWGVDNKNLVGIPWRVAFALQADGWILRSDIIWAKKTPMPESVKDRPTKSHEHVFLLAKSPQYFYDSDAISEEAVSDREDHRFGGDKYLGAEGGVQDHGGIYKSTGRRNKRDVWSIAAQPFKNAHFAVMPEALVEPCVLAGSRGGDWVLDPFAGSGTVGVVALRHDRNFTGIELNPKYADLARWRIVDDAPLLNVGSVFS